MKNIHKEGGSFRRWVKQVFASLMKRQNSDCEAGFETILGKLLDIEDSIEIIAREIERQSKRSK